MLLKWVVAAVAVVALAWALYPSLTGRQPETATAGDVVGSGGSATRSSAGSACSGTAGPAKFDFTLMDMDGKSVNLADYRGKAVLLNFWATWCPPCKTEIPAFIELQEKYRDRGFVVLGVSTDDPADALQQFAAQYKINYPVLQGTEAIMDAYGPIWAIPVSVLINRDGTICKKHMGPATKEEFEKDIKALL